VIYGSSPSGHLHELSPNIRHLQNTIILSLNGVCTSLLNQSKTEFLLIAELPNISEPYLLMPSSVTMIPAQSTRNLGFMFNCTLSMSVHISSLLFLNLASNLFAIFEG